MANIEKLCKLQISPSTCQSLKLQLNRLKSRCTFIGEFVYIPLNIEYIRALFTSSFTFLMNFDTQVS